MQNLNLRKNAMSKTGAVFFFDGEPAVWQQEGEGKRKGAGANIIKAIYMNVQNQ
jgi:hypothetical protein